MNSITTGADRREIGDIVLCPSCGTDATHVDSVRLIAADGRGWQLDASGEDNSAQVASHAVTTEPSGRRHRIVLIGTCEQGCSFELRWTQHKGGTYLAVTAERRAEAVIAFDSIPEELFWRAYQASSPLELSGLVGQHRVDPYRLDFAIPHRRIGIEIDGLAFHNGQESFMRDRRRQRQLELQGWRIIRFAAKEILEDAVGCVAEAARLAGSG